MPASFHFVGHTDVVPAGPIESWEVIPLFLHPEMASFWARSSRYEASLAAMVTAIERF